MRTDSPTEKKIWALLRLLSDPNEGVAATVQAHLIQFGESVLPYLTAAEQEEPRLSSRIAGIREEIYFSGVKKDFQKCCADNGDNIELEVGVFLIARSAYPTLDVAYYGQIIQNLAEECRPRLRPADSLELTIKTFNRYLFKEKAFHGNRNNYYDPENSFLNRVLDRRTGIPISLSVLYILLGQRLGLPLLGVGMPGHFLVKVDTLHPLLFVDCFNEGILLRESDCKNFLTRSGFGFEPLFLEPSPTHLILERMLRNLLGVYHQRGETNRMERVNALMDILKSNPPG